MSSALELFQLSVLFLLLEVKKIEGEAQLRGVWGVEFADRRDERR
jgi:hypothetical protein